MRSPVLAVLISFAVSSCLFADAASLDAKIEKLLVLTKASDAAVRSQMIDSARPQIDNMIQHVAQVSAIPPEQVKSATADLQAKVMAALEDFSSWEKAKPALIAAYRDTYTENEIDGLLAFFNSPIGQAWLTKSPLVTAKTASLNAKRQNDFTLTIQGIVKEWVDQHHATVPPK